MLSKLETQLITNQVLKMRAESVGEQMKISTRDDTISSLHVDEKAMIRRLHILSPNHKGEGMVLDIAPFI